MNDLNEKIKQGYESAELPEELRLRVRREILTAAETEKEGGITMSRKIKRPATIALVAAAALTVSVTAGAAAFGIFHKESIDSQLGEGAAEYLESNIEFRSYSTENEYMRITADAVFCDGHSVVIYATKERLTDPYFGWVYDEDTGYWYDQIHFDLNYSDGTFPVSAGGSTDFIEPTEDGVTYERYEVNSIEEGKAIVLSFEDFTDWDEMYDSLDEEGRRELFAREDYYEYREEMLHPESVQGLSITIDDLTPNVELINFADENGRQLYLTPYMMGTDQAAIFNSNSDLTLKNSITGEQKIVEIHDGGGGGYVDGVTLYTYSEFFSELVNDVNKYDIVEIEDVGTFYRQ